MSTKVETQEFPLTKIEPPDARELFAGDGVDRIVAYLTQAAQAATAGADVKTKEGQAKIRSAARDVSSSKVVLDKAGKALVDSLRAEVADITQQIQQINAGRDALAEKCNALRDATRAPLTEFEQAEAKRIADLEADLKAMAELAHVGPQHTSRQIRSAMKLLEEYNSPELDWQEYDKKAAEVYGESKTLLTTALAAAEKREAEAEELAKVKAELEEARRVEAARVAEEKRQRELKEAADKARAEAEAMAAKKIAQVEERARQEANAREQAAAQAIRDSEERAAKAEADKEAAVLVERQRVEAERASEAKRAANKKHREKVHAEIEAALRAGPTTADGIVAAIAAGKIPHLQIVY